MTAFIYSFSRRSAVAAGLFERAGVDDVPRVTVRFADERGFSRARSDRDQRSGDIYRVAEQRQS